MNVTPIRFTTAPTHTALAQQSYDQFASAYRLGSELHAGEPGALETAVRHVNDGVALLGQAYAAIPAGGYHPGNEALTASWAAQAVTELRTGSTARALSTLDEILERVSNDFDLG